MDKKTKYNLGNIEEETVNTLMFRAWVFFTVGAFVMVVGFLGGTFKDWIALAVTVVGLVIRFLEKKAAWFKKYAKYAYLTLPVWCTYGLALDNEGNFAAVTQAWFLLLALSVAYHDVKMVYFCAATTIGSTVCGFIYAPEAMLKLDNPGVWFYILSIYIMAIYFCSFIAKHIDHLIAKERQIKAYEDELVYLEQLEKKEEKHSEFIHNINHYFVAISELARVEHCEQIVNMLDELNGNLLQNERVVYTSHKVLNAILSKKASEAMEKQIELDIYVEPLLSLENIADCDIVAMLGNLFDNALEAAEQCECEKRKIFVRIYMEKEGKLCVVKLVNYFSASPVQHKSRFVSTKKNPQMHGIGIKSVENMAKKYGGYLQCRVEEEKFLSILILPVE